MEEDLIDQRLSACILRTLKVPSFTLRRNTKAFEVPGWDSLSHVEVIMAVEDEYRVRFATGDLLALQSVGDLQALVRRVAPG